MENDEGVNALLDIVCANLGRRANELAVLVGKCVKTVERYVRTLKDAVYCVSEKSARS